jgi:hypothetical protein
MQAVAVAERIRLKLAPVLAVLAVVVTVLKVVVLAQPEPLIQVEAVVAEAEHLLLAVTAAQAALVL